MRVMAGALEGDMFIGPKAEVMTIQNIFNMCLLEYIVHDSKNPYR